MKFINLDSKKINKELELLYKIQHEFLSEFGVNDIMSNSKIYEIIIANDLNHDLIPGHSGTRDASLNGEEFEYKHFKKSSSNHSWTFNDFSSNTIGKLNSTSKVYFCHINDQDYPFPGNLDWYFEIHGSDVSKYLITHTKKIKNNRKMINVSANQIIRRLGYKKKFSSKNDNGKYSKYLNDIFKISRRLELLTQTNNILTSNKLWEVILASRLNHNVNSEQGGRKGAHDAYDKFGNNFEYKISKSFSWNFQDISDNVLNKYKSSTKYIYLAVVDKKNFKLNKIYECDSSQIVLRLKQKLKEKVERFESQGKKIRRKQVSISKGDLNLIKYRQIDLAV